jgi:hypothetical protein
VELEVAEQAQMVALLEPPTLAGAVVEATGKVRHTTEETAALVW